MKKILFISFLFTLSVYSQPNGLSISPKADSLLKLVTQFPQNVKFRQQLIGEFLNKGQPELALLGILQLYHQDLPTGDINQNLNSILFFLGKKQIVFNKLVKQYLKNPLSPNNLYLAVDDWALGNKKRAIRFLNSLRPNLPNLSIQLASLYQKLYFMKRETLAKASSELLENFNFSEYARLFPKPRLFIISPENNFFTNNSNVEVNFSVKHTKAIKLVRVNDKVLFRNKDKVENEKFNKNFNTRLTLKPGENTINIYAEDVFGYSESKSISVFAATFNQLPISKNSLTDTLQYLSDLLHNYTSNMIKSQPQPFNRAILISGETNSSANSSPNLWRMLLTNYYAGTFSTGKIKPLIGKYCTRKNIEKVTSQWLMQQLNIKTNGLIYLKGEFQNVGNSWQLKISDGAFDIGKFLNQYRKFASNSLTLIIESKFKPNFANYLIEILKKSGIQSNLILLSDSMDYNALLHSLLIPKDLKNYNSSVNFFDYYSTTDSSCSFIKFNNVAFSPINFPAKEIYGLHKSLYSALQKKLAKLKMKRKKKDIILKYAESWQRILEINDFLKGKISLSDLLTYVNEFFNRKEKVIQ